MDAKDIAEDLLQDTDVGVEEAEQAETPPPEKMLPASQVNELIKKAKRKGEQKMQEQLDAAKQQIEQLTAQQAQQQLQNTAQTGSPQQPQQSQGQQQGVDPQQIQQQVMQLLQQKQQEDEQKRHQEQIEQEVNQVAQQYFGKMAQGKDMFDDFEAITADFNPAEFPQLVFLANQMDNTPAIIYELRKNPGKLADLAVLVEKSPSMARNELSKLSESIKRNDEAKRNLQEPQDPLNRLKPSPVGTDNGTKNVRDFKTASYLKG
jgi:galactitol-specific phosphotransferase system IIB component